LTSGFRPAGESELTRGGLSSQCEVVVIFCVCI
jgi:hypothetical protein